MAGQIWRLRVGNVTFGDLAKRSGSNPCATVARQVQSCYKRSVSGDGSWGSVVTREGSVSGDGSWGKWWNRRDRGGGLFSSYRLSVRLRWERRYSCQRPMHRSPRPGHLQELPPTPGNGSAIVKWKAPVNNGGSAITGYLVRSTPGSKTCKTTGAKTCTIRGLKNGTNYTVTVKARNKEGLGTASVPCQGEARCALGPQGRKSSWR